MAAAGSKKFKTVGAPTRRRIGQPLEQIPLPERRWYQWLGDAFTRLDELAEAQLKALNVIIEQNNVVIAILSGVPPEAIPGLPVPLDVFRNYISEDQLKDKDVVNAATPVDIEVLETLGRRARYGFVYSETGTLIVKINEGAPIPLKAADFLNLWDQHLEIEKMRIETESVADITFRLLLV